MTRMEQVVASAAIEWDDEEPLAWEIKETAGPPDDRQTTIRKFDLTGLRAGYSDALLLTLKDLLVERRKHIALNSIHAEYSSLRSLLLKVYECGLLEGRVIVIDQPFLLALRTILADVSTASLYTLKKYFHSNRKSALFASDLVLSDFPLKAPAKGFQGALMSRILAKALNRAACVQILGAAEAAWEEKLISLGQFCFLQIAFHLYLRPYSYRRLTLNDLKIDVDRETQAKRYFLLVYPAKTRSHTPMKIALPLNSQVGDLLALQRVHVIKTFGHLVDEANIGKLALFPQQDLNDDGHWESETAQAHYGRSTDASLRRQYLDPIIRLPKSLPFTFNGLRHTIGTQLAVAGCNSKTIQAVLKHASDGTCQAYVDIAFHGLIEELSDAMEPAFATHFPLIERFRSKHDRLAPEKTIKSVDLDSGRRELTGECGRQIACQYAPISCYACPRFIPCYDADHSMNLDLVEAEIDRYMAAGLPYRHLLEKSKEARLHIQFVIAASERYCNAIKMQEAP